MLVSLSILLLCFNAVLSRSTEEAFGKCESDFTRKQCKEIEVECATAFGSPLARIRSQRQISEPVTECLFHGGIMGQCISHHGSDHCYEWEGQCAVALGAPSVNYAPNSYHKLPPNVANCLLSIDTMTLCKQKLGADKCNEIEVGCKKQLDELNPKNGSGSPHILSTSVLKCISSTI